MSDDVVRPVPKTEVPIRHIEYSHDCNVYRVFFNDGTKTEVPGTMIGWTKDRNYHELVAEAIALEFTGQQRVPLKFITKGFEYDQEAANP